MDVFSLIVMVRRLSTSLSSQQTFSLEGLSTREVAACVAEFEYFGLPSLVPAFPALNLEMSTKEGGATTAVVASSNDSCLISAANMGQNMSNGWSWAIGSDTVADEATWKITINTLESTNLIMGVISNRCLVYLGGQNTYQDPSFYGWYDHAKFTIISGHLDFTQVHGWPGWIKGDEGIFKLNAEAGLLEVYLRRTGRRYTIGGLPSYHAGLWDICVMSITGTSSLSVTATPVPEGELALAM
jgi:hypothetical protein